MNSAVGGDDGDFAILTGDIGEHTGHFANSDEGGVREETGFNDDDEGDARFVGAPGFDGYFALVSIVEQYKIALF